MSIEGAQESGERYPESVTLVRHAESLYNELKKKVTSMPSFKEFHELFKAEYYANPIARTPHEHLDLAVLEGQWPSPELRNLAIGYYKDIRKLMHGVSDFDTPITERGHQQAQETGLHLPEHIEKPDIIYVSPYLRTNQTLEDILDNAPSDWKDIQVWNNETIREQEHGMQTVYNDWRLSFVFEPEEMIHYNKQGPYSYRYKGGESKFDVRDRSSRFIGRLRRKHEGQKVMAITHHLTILSTMAEILHWTREDFLEWDENRRPANCGVTIFKREEGASRTGRDLLQLDDEDYSRVLYSK